jgi:hypothetical protein
MTAPLVSRKLDELVVGGRPRAPLLDRGLPADKLRQLGSAPLERLVHRVVERLADPHVERESDRQQPAPSDIARPAVSRDENRKPAHNSGDLAVGSQAGIRLLSRFPGDSDPERTVDLVSSCRTHASTHDRTHGSTVPAHGRAAPARAMT